MPALTLRRLSSAAVAVALAPTAIALGAPATPAADFYHPPTSLVAGAHGSVIWSRPISGTPGLVGAKNWLVLYRSVTDRGQTVATSGVISVPATPAPPGGWPLISWAHGTTGVADVCAPSKDSATGPAHGYLSVVDPVLTQWVQHGYAVARTDYQGLGTDGPHAYLTGVPEARAVADIALAAHQLVPDVGTRWLAAGHSQGGGAAVFAAALGQSWAPSIRLLGAIDLASGSHMSEAIRVAQPIPNSGGLYPFLIRGVEVTAPLDEPAILTPKALGLLPQADSKCRDALNQPDSFGGMSGSDIFRSDADLSTFYKVLHDNDPAAQHPAVPVFIGQGTTDTTCPEPLTDALAASLIADGADVTYKVYPGADHRGVIPASFDDALQFANAQLTSMG